MILDSTCHAEPGCTPKVSNCPAMFKNIYITFYIYIYIYIDYITLYIYILYIYI